MTGNDLTYLELCIKAGLVRSPVLDVGSAKVQGMSVPNVCEFVKAHGIGPCVGTDLISSIGVDVVTNFSLPGAAFAREWAGGQFSTVSVFNVLEHTFDPASVLENALSCVMPGGTLLVVTPVVWPLHNYPGDYVRIMPQWYVEFARRHSVAICQDAFRWISMFGLTPVQTDIGKGEGQIPTYQYDARRKNAIRYWVSRIVHRSFNTYGRSLLFPHVTLGVAIMVG